MATLLEARAAHGQRWAAAPALGGVATPSTSGNGCCCCSHHSHPPRPLLEAVAVALLAASLCHRHLTAAASA